MEFRLGRRDPLLPATKEDTLTWLAETAGLVKYETAQTWVSHLRRALVDRDLDASALESAFFRRGMKGIKKLKGDSAPRQASPVTLPILGLVV